VVVNTEESVLDDKMARLPMQGSHNAQGAKFADNIHTEVCVCVSVRGHIVKSNKGCLDYEESLGEMKWKDTVSVAVE
jgi:hypothetical protein